MKKINKNNLISAVAVFSFVAFCFAIANTFGTSYAISVDVVYKLPENINDVYKLCNKCGINTTEGALEGKYYREVDSGNACTKLGEHNETNSIMGGVEYCVLGEYKLTLLDKGNVIYEESFPGGTKVTLPELTKDGTELVHWFDSTSDDPVNLKAGYEMTMYTNHSYTTFWQHYCWKCEATNTYEWYDGRPEQSCASTWIKQTSINNLANCKAPSSGGDSGSGGTTNPTTYKVYFGSITDHGATFYKNENPTTTYTQSVSGNSINLSNYKASSDEYDFKGWTYGYNSDGSCEAILPNTLTLREETTNVYACWVKKQTTEEETEMIDIVANAGAGYISYVEAVDDLEEGTKTYTQSCLISDSKTKCSVAGEVEAEREGYIFTGWGTNSICTSGKSITEFSISKNTTVYACWEEATSAYDVKFNTNNGTLYRNENKSTTSIYSLVKLDYSEFIAKKDGYIFKGWRTDKQNCNNAVKTGSVTLNNDLELYACYEEEKSEITENPSTGSSLLYIAFLTGILALCYTGYYSYSYIKSRK